MSAETMTHRVKKGLDLPILGTPEPVVERAEEPRRIALVAADYVGMKPTMQVQVGDVVRRGQVLFDDKKTAGVRYTAPAGGKVVGIHRGDRRALLSVVIETSSDERAGRGESVRFAAFGGRHPAELGGEEIKDLLLESGLWTALRTRPFSKVADPAAEPHSIFVTATDTQPLAPDLGVVLAGDGEAFERGLVAVAKLTSGKVFLCAGEGLELQLPRLDRLEVHRFTGKHPAGTAGFHIHTLDPVDRRKTVWDLGAQDVVAIGRLFASGELDLSRVISLAGPGVRRPRLLRTRVGAAIDELVDGELIDGELRQISGSVLTGRIAAGDVTGYLGRYHQQVSVLREDRRREFLGWLAPGFGKYSIVNVFLSRLRPGKKFDLTTTTHGSDRAIVPIGSYERVFPIDIPATFLMRALAVRDLERSEQLGCLELDEEDVALCSFVCPGKHEYGPYLREVLTTLEKEG